MKINKLQIDYIKQRFNQKAGERINAFKETLPDVISISSYKVKYDLMKKHTDIKIKPYQDLNYSSDIGDVFNAINYPALNKVVAKIKKDNKTRNDKLQAFEEKERIKANDLMDKIIIDGEPFETVFKKF